MEKIAVITGADGGMGTEITRALALAGHPIVMLCFDRERGEACCRRLAEETGNRSMTVKQVDLSSMPSVRKVTDEILAEGRPIGWLMNNAGTMATSFQRTDEGFERTVAVNYLAPFLLTNRLLPLMDKGTRIVCMVSCTYAIGKLPDCFFTDGKEGAFWRIPIYSNTKLALWLFARELSKRVASRGISVNAADPGIVSTDIITMHMWFDPLTDILFRPFIRTPRKGAATAVSLLLDKDAGERTGTLNVSCHPKQLSERFTHHKQAKELWERTELLVKKWL